MADIPRQSFVYFIDPDGETEVYPVLPVLTEKENEFQKYKNRVVVAYAHTQELIEASTVPCKPDIC